MRNKVEITERMVYIHHSSKQSKLSNTKNPEKNVSFSLLEWSLLLAIILETDEWTKKLKENSETGAKTWDLRRHGEGNKRVTVTITEKVSEMTKENCIRPSQSKTAYEYRIYRLGVS